MNGHRKTWFLVAAILTIAGAAIFVGALAVIRFDLPMLSTQRMETSTYELDEDFDRIFVKVETAAVTFLPSDNGVCRVECTEEESLKHAVEVQDGTLTISAVNHRKWYDYICINFWSPRVTVYLPKAVYASLSVTTATGDVEIPGDFSFETVAVTGTTSKVMCLAQASKRIALRTTTGSITLGPSQTETIDLSATTGRVTVNDVACLELTAKSSTGHIQLTNVIARERIKAENTTGGITFDGCDAADIRAKTSTGNIRGTLLSEKLFVTDTSTGRVSVPETAGGGRCEITTTTGDIEIEIEK